jgi:hypothetical protein
MVQERTTATCVCRSISEPCLSRNSEEQKGGEDATAGFAFLSTPGAAGLRLTVDDRIILGNWGAR